MDGSEDVLLRLLAAASWANLHHLRRNPGTPLLYESGIVYDQPDQLKRPNLDRAKVLDLVRRLRAIGLEPEDALMVLQIVRGVEVFLDIPTLYRRGRGDCNILVPVRVAECWLAGVVATPWLTKSRGGWGGWAYHATLVHPDGTEEDPSLILGMGGRARAADRYREIQKNVERLDDVTARGAELVRAGADLRAVADAVDAVGLVPRDGVFRAPRGARSSAVDPFARRAA